MAVQLGIRADTVYALLDVACRCAAKGSFLTRGLLASGLLVLSGCERVSNPPAGWLPDGSAYPTRRSWSPEHNAMLNVSLFVFRDVNANGAYDVGDRPAAGVAVRLWRPDGSSVLRRSNIHGFANFTNSLTASPVDVGEPGTYVFEVLFPDGWGLTSSNKSQTIQYEARSDARPGIVANKVPDPVGLTQLLTIGGRVVERVEDGGITRGSVEVSAVSPHGVTESVALDDDGSFMIDAGPGSWQIRVTAPDSTVWIERTVPVDQAPVRMSSMVLGAPVPAPAPDRRTIDFEDVTTSRIAKIPNGSGGLGWTDLIVVQNEMYGGEGYINGTVSGQFVGYNSSGYPVAIHREEGFDFYGGYFAVAWPAAHGETLIVRAWRGELPVGSEEYTLSALGPFWFAADYHAITRLELSTRHHWQFVTDDLLVGLRRP